MKEFYNACAVIKMFVAPQKKSVMWEFRPKISKKGFFGREKVVQKAGFYRIDVELGSPYHKTFSAQSPDADCYRVEEDLTVTSRSYVELHFLSKQNSIHYFETEGDRDKFVDDIKTNYRLSNPGRACLVELNTSN